MKIPNFILVFIFGLTSFNLFGQTSDSSNWKHLVVYGDEFIFGVKEPDNWLGDIDNAKKYQANIIFYKSKVDFENGGVLIQVYSFRKQDEKTEDDLEYDIKSYKEKYKDLKEQTFLVSHKNYKCYSKMVYVENVFYQYTVYINPGLKYKRGLSVAMNIQFLPATDEQLKAFREIISSLLMMKG